MPKKIAEFIDADERLEVNCKCPYCGEHNLIITYAGIYGVGDGDEETCMSCDKVFIWKLEKDPR